MSNFQVIFYKKKFTLFYTILSLILGGITMASWAFLYGVVVDKFMNKKQWSHRGFTTSMVWFSHFSIVIFFYPATILYSSDGSLIYQWIRINMGLVDAVADFVPVINNYTDQMIENGEDASEIVKIRHLHGVFWFVGIIFLPLLYNDLFRSAKFLKEENYAKVIASHDKVKTVVIIFSASLVLFILFFSIFAGILNSSFFGDNPMPDIRYKLGRWNTLSVIVMTAPFFAFIFGALHADILCKLFKRQYWNDDVKLENHENNIIVLTHESASIFKRLMANVIDFWLLLLLSFFVFGMTVMVFDKGVMSSLVSFIIVYAVVFWFTYLYSHNSCGKRIMGMKMVLANGKSLDFKKSLVVSLYSIGVSVFIYGAFVISKDFLLFLEVLFSLFLLLNITAFFSQSKMSVQDFLCGTRVIMDSKKKEK